MLAPILLEGRLIQRELFNSRKSVDNGVSSCWDEPFPEDLLPRWQRWKDQLNLLNNLTGSRSFYTREILPIIKRELFVYSDASITSVGFCIFLRCVGENGIDASLVCAGSKLAPRAAVSVPRLELVAAVEASAAALKVKEELQVGQSDIYYYTDSRIVIGYLTNTERRFKRYVGRRIELISNMTARSEWHCL